MVQTTAGNIDKKVRLFSRLKDRRGIMHKKGTILDVTILERYMRKKLYRIKRVEQLLTTYMRDNLEGWPMTIR